MGIGTLRQTDEFARRQTIEEESVYGPAAWALRDRLQPKPIA